MSQQSFENLFGEFTPEAAKSYIKDNKVKPIEKFKRYEMSVWDKHFKNFAREEDYSVYTGSCGIALLKLLMRERCETAQGKLDLLNEAKQLVPTHRLNKRRITFLCGDAGPLAIGAVIEHKLGNPDAVDRYIDKLKALNVEVLDMESVTANEVLYGRAGYLYALLYVKKNISELVIEDAMVEEVCKVIILLGRKQAQAMKSDSPLMYSWHDTHYLGAAHGVAGILYMLLQAHKYVQESDMTLYVKPTIDYLITLRFPGGNYPSSLGKDRDRLVQWCHGAPGYTHLFSLAYKRFGHSIFKHMALQCGDIVWQRGILTKGYSLCHGVAGNAYTFLELFQLTGDEKHLFRACKFAEWCTDYTTSHEFHYPDRPNSLYEGLAGRLYLIIDMQKPKEAKFPGYQL